MLTRMECRLYGLHRVDPMKLLDLSDTGWTSSHRHPLSTTRSIATPTYDACDQHNLILICIIFHLLILGQTLYGVKSWGHPIRSEGFQFKRLEFSIAEPHCRVPFRISQKKLFFKSRWVSRS